MKFTLTCEFNNREELRQFLGGVIATPALTETAATLKQTDDPATPPETAATAAAAAAAAAAGETPPATGRRGRRGEGKKTDAAPPATETEKPKFDVMNTNGGVGATFDNEDAAATAFVGLLKKAPHKEGLEALISANRPLIEKFGQTNGILVQQTVTDLHAGFDKAAGPPKKAAPDMSALFGDDEVEQPKAAGGTTPPLPVDGNGKPDEPAIRKVLSTLFNHVNTTRGMTLLQSWCPEGATPQWSKVPVSMYEHVWDMAHKLLEMPKEKLDRGWPQTEKLDWDKLSAA